jgi:predicted nucleic acid-binding protein
VFVDTDLILDVLLKREPFFAPAARLLQRGLEGRITLLVSAGALKDVFYFARKATAEDARQGLTAGNERRGREAVQLLLQVFEVCSLDRGMWDAALASPPKDTEDALQAACAAHHDADFLVTRNLRHYTGTARPQVLLPDMLLAILETHGVSAAPGGDLGAPPEKK